MHTHCQHSLPEDDNKVQRDSPISFLYATPTTQVKINLLSKENIYLVAYLITDIFIPILPLPGHFSNYLTHRDII